MSYRLGFQAFVKRFKDRFPEPEYRYVVSIQDTQRSAPRIFAGDNFWVHLSESGGNLRSITIYHRASDTKVCTIDANVTFGIRLNVQSAYLKRELYFHRRPKNLIFQNQHGMRHWLEDKPKFAKLGASLASQIHFAFAKACSACETSVRKYDKLCEQCHQTAIGISDMQSEGAPSYDSVQ